ncbi:glycosyltransferase [Polaribacter butkevichii]|uniref:Glycosyl transferase family 1 domain-containing protein n=1 Tax=Polaribacter butkevichii TaxID=218490 RepID=A0A2P6CEI8_9FLAO|nr:glycosyltransferase [Polaribacter butkevichii]PQJ73322.1 hypothetical protein BTO14_08630 [Polaribacter butkevichii]
MQKTRILFIVDSFPTLSETFIVNQITGLIDEGYDIRIFSIAENKKVKIHQVIKEYRLLEKTYYNTIRIPVKKYKRILYALTLLISKFYKIQWRILFNTLNIKKHKKEAYNLNLFYKSIYFVFNKMPHIIHVHFGHNGIKFSELKDLNIIPSSVKIVVTFHGYDLFPNKETFYRNKYKLLFKKATVFTVNTVYLKNLLKAVNPRLKNIELLPMGPNLKLFKVKKANKRNTEEPINISYCGRLINLKGSCLMIDIAKVLKEKEISFKMNIIGEGELMDELQQKTKDFNLENFIKFYGGLSQEKIKNIFKESHLFISPGIEDEVTKRAETQGLVIQEAQAMALPVLVSDAGGMQYGMIDGKTGYVLPQKDINAFVNKIIYLKENEEVRQIMGNYGMRYVNNHFTTTKLTKDLIDKVYYYE